MLVSSDKVVLPCCIKTNTCALSKKRKAQTIAVIKRKTERLYEEEKLLMVIVIVMTITITMIMTIIVITIIIITIIIIIMIMITIMITVMMIIIIPLILTK